MLDRKICETHILEEMSTFVPFQKARNSILNQSKMKKSDFNNSKEFDSFYRAETCGQPCIAIENSLLINVSVIWN